MATTVSTLLERLAYRLGENASPSDANEQARRISFLSEAQRKALGESYWWFTQTIASTSTIANQDTYDLASDFRDMIELRVDRKVTQYLPDPVRVHTYDETHFNYDQETLIDRYWIFNDSELHLVPIPSEAPTTFTLSTLTSSGTTATATTSSAHGIKVNDYITIAGANETAYNGVFKVTSTPSSTTLTYTLSSSTTSPATGTITMQWNNILYRYWQQHTDFTATTDTTIIPDRFTDILVAYALGRKMSGTLEDERGSAGDAFEEYNAILRDMRKENNRKKFMYKDFMPRSYQDTTV